MPSLCLCQAATVLNLHFVNPKKPTEVLENVGPGEWVGMSVEMASSRRKRLMG